MNSREVLSNLCNAIETNDFGTAATYLTDDFVFSGPTPQPIGKDEFLGVHAAVVAGFPNWKFNVHNINETTSNEVKANVQVSGTHSGTLDLSPIGLPKIPATGKQVTNRVEDIRCTFENGKMKSWAVTPTPNGGIPEILRQIGVELPH